MAARAFQTIVTAAADAYSNAQAEILAKQQEQQRKSKAAGKEAGAPQSDDQTASQAMNLDVASFDALLSPLAAFLSDARAHLGVGTSEVSTSTATPSTSQQQKPGQPRPPPLPQTVDQARTEEEQEIDELLRCLITAASRLVAFKRVPSAACVFCLSLISLLLCA